MMILKRILWLSIATFLLIGTGLAKETAKKPAYYKSNPSHRYVRFTSTTTQSASRNPIHSLLHAEIPETLRVMAIRVQFQRDNDRSTTGDGWFDLSVGDSMINPPPHDYNYFSNQLRALRDYYWKVSGGKLFLRVEDENGMGFVYPREYTNDWDLPHQMGYYNPDETEELLDQRLAELFRDAITIADANSDIDFSRFDVFIIFHAGVGWEFTQDFDTTPKDIPSVFLNYNDLKKALADGSADFNGIPVNNGSFHVKEGIILPETENQGGYKTFGLLGTAALMMGHQLGLPNLFDTDTGHPGIGRFGLMDQGSGNFMGNIPAQPCAWSKIFLGWEQPILVTSGDSLPVAASLAANPQKIYKIPINAREYFLVENRQRNVLQQRNIGIGYDENGTRIEFYDDGSINPQTGIGVITAVEEYDYGLPGSGILIWHIDDAVIEQKYAENRVNTDMNHRGVDLVEADGSQDMGYYYNNFGFTGYHAGYAEDMWWKNNQAHLYANSADQVMFTPFTMPGSYSFSRANTGIYMTRFSDIDSVMYFSLAIKGFHAGFPAFLGDNAGTSAIVTGDLDGDGQNEIVAATNNGKLLAWRSDGEKFIANTDSADQVTVAGDTLRLPLAVFAELGDDVPLAPALADLDHMGGMEVIVPTGSGKLLAFRGADTDGNGRADLFFEISFGAAITTVPVVGNWRLNETGSDIALGLQNGDACLVDESGNLLWKKNLAAAAITGVAGFIENERHGIVAVDATGGLSLVDGNGEIVWQRSFGQYGSLNYPVVGDVANDGKPEIIITTDQGYLLVLNQSGEVLPESQIVSLNAPLSSPTLADLDNDHFLDIVFTGGGKIFAYRFNGTPLTNFPITVDPGREQETYPEPILADLDGDGKAEIIVASKSSQVLAYSYQGRKIADFSRSVSQPIVSSPAITDLNGNGKFDLIARAGDNYCYVWQLESDSQQGQLYWAQYQQDAGHDGLFQWTVSPPARQGELMPARMVYNYPNPTEGTSTTIRYFLRDAAEVVIRIYDMSGELVREMSGPGAAALENEVTWDISNVQSGVYLARVMAKSATETNAVIIKIAVVK